MKRLVRGLVLLVLILGLSAWAIFASVNVVNAYAVEENQKKAARVQQRLDETLDLLTELSEDDFIRDANGDYRDKAIFLTNKNRAENLGYMMLRILDGEINIYREDIGLASNLASREYMQKLYNTGESQVTDAFLAGADGTTINYTVAVGIKDENGRVYSALMAAIFGTEIDAYLTEGQADTVLVGSDLQYMGGIPEERFGLAVAQVLEGEGSTSRPVENILLDFQEAKPGSFWGLGRGGVQYFIYTPLENCPWTVMTEVRAMPLITRILIFYGAGLVLILAAAFIWPALERLKVKKKSA